MRARLRDAGVSGAEELGRFVSNPELFGASSFDERAAMPVLIVALPTLTDALLVSAVAGHLRRAWARPAAFESVLAAFEAWAERDPTTGWHLGDAVGTTATAAHADSLLRVSRDTKYGTARQMVVYALGRFKTVPGVRETLLRLIDEPGVALHAMYALRRVLGPREALVHLERVEREQRGTIIGDQATREVKKARKALS
ncbi:MAG: hypothetical protein QOG52_1690 [Frankiaceae bacterium]|nr:hypothetical protein [Frankiaceae bacterium]